MECIILLSLIFCCVHATNLTLIITFELLNIECVWYFVYVNLVERFEKY